MTSITATVDDGDDNQSKVVVLLMGIEKRCQASMSAKESEGIRLKFYWIP